MNKEVKFEFTPTSFLVHYNGKSICSMRPYSVWGGQLSKSYAQDACDYLGCSIEEFMKPYETMMAYALSEKTPQCYGTLEHECCNPECEEDEDDEVY